MWTVSHIAALAYLGILSIRDIRTRKIPAFWIGIGALLVGVDRILNPDMSPWIWGGGLLLGAGFLLVSWLTREKLGYGDSLMLMLYGCDLGIWNALFGLTIAFLSCALVSVAGMVLGKFGQKDSVPFLPFLFLGLLGVILC